MSEEKLNDQRARWQSKPVLRAIYEDMYERIAAACVAGATLEVGGGSGNMKEYREDVVSTDLVPTPWLDAAADAQSLPFRDASFANIVLFDVLHHIERPRRFLSEADRVLRPGGRIILMEPGITPLSRIFYKLFHPEPVDMRDDPLADGPLDPARKPFDANQAIPTLLVGRHRERMLREFPALRILRAERMSLLAYPLSGGFRPWSLIPVAGIGTLLRFENAFLRRPFARIAAFRLFIILEKTSLPAA
jgi:SAM-dependent methyltransferase